MSAAQDDALKTIDGMEAAVGRAIGEMDSRDPSLFDQRWLSIAYDHLEIGFMAIGRSVLMGRSPESSSCACSAAEPKPKTKSKPSQGDREGAGNEAL